jgi:hypothetical protein
MLVPESQPQRVEFHCLAFSLGVRIFNYFPGENFLPRMLGSGSPSWTKQSVHKAEAEPDTQV